MDPILIVDDERHNLDALRRLLRTDYEVFGTTSPIEALKWVQEREYSVIVSDQRMPEISGVDLFEKIKNITPQSTRILLTGYTDIDAVIDAINRGHIYRYVAKPWDPDDLKLTLKQATEAYHLKKQVEHKSEQLKANNAELRAAFEQLTLLDRAKARFLSLVSHELNTPLTVLKSYIQILTDAKENLPKEARGAVGSIEEASERFGDIIQEVLTYVRLEAKARFQLESFNLENASHEVAQFLKQTHNERNNTITISATGIPIVYCDPENMQVALHKLLEDALLRSPNLEPIQVHISAENNNVNYLVQRAGKPISAEAFLPLDSGSNIMHHHQDLGLSLAICKLIVEGNRGEMRLVESNAKKTVIQLILSSRQPA